MCLTAAAHREKKVDEKFLFGSTTLSTVLKNP